MAIYYYTGKDYRKTPKGAKIHRTPAPFSSLAAIENCNCEDGKRRYVRITGEPDTFFSVPARITYKGKTISGFVSYDDDNEPKFTATGKNKALIKSATSY